MLPRSTLIWLLAAPLAPFGLALILSFWPDDVPITRPYQAADALGWICFCFGLGMVFMNYLWACALKPHGPLQRKE